VPEKGEEMIGTNVCPNRINMFIGCGGTEKAVKAYIQNELQENQIVDQVSIKGFVDRLRAERVPRHNQNLKGLCVYKAL